MQSYPSSNVAAVTSPAPEKNRSAGNTTHCAARAISRTRKADNSSTDLSHVAEKPPFTDVKDGNWLTGKAKKAPTNAILQQVPHHFTSSIAKPKKPYGGEYRPMDAIRNGNQTSRKYGKGNRESFYSPFLHTNAKDHTSARALEPDHKTTLNAEHHIKRRRIGDLEETLLGGNGFATNVIDKSSVRRWPGYLAERNLSANLNIPTLDFTMGKAAEFNKVENNLNLRNNRTQCKPSNKGRLSSHPSSASSPITNSPINGTKNSPILLADDFKLVGKFNTRTSSSPSDDKTTHSALKISQKPMTSIINPHNCRKETKGDAMPSEDYVLNAASRSSPSPSVAREKMEVAKGVKTRLRLKEHRNSVDELQGDCNITPSGTRAQDNSLEHHSSSSNSLVVLEEPSKEDGLTKLCKKEKSSEPVDTSARDIWPLRLYRTDSDDYKDAFLVFDEEKKHFEIEIHKEKGDKEIIDKSRINRMRCSDAGSKVVIDGPRKKDLATIHAFDFEQNKHCELFIKKIEDMEICERGSVQRKDIVDLDKIFEDVAKKRWERELRRLSNEKQGEQEVGCDGRLQKASKRRISLSCPTSESKRLRNENGLGQEVVFESIPQRRSVRHLSRTYHSENSASQKPFSKPDDLDKKEAQYPDPQNLEPWPEPIIYPSTGANRTTVEFEDVSRLEDGEFLNDNIISFYLRYLYDYWGQNRDKVYIFNTYFFSRLTSGAKKDIDYEAVEKWTSKVNIFNYEYLVVPVNHSLHWYLVIIYNSSHKEKATHTDQSKASSAVVESKATWPSEHKVECISKDDSAVKQDHNTSALRKDLRRLALNELASAVGSESLKERREMLFSDHVDRPSLSENNISKYFAKSNVTEIPDGKLKPIHNDGNKLKDGPSPSKAASRENKARFFLISLDSFGETRPQVLRALKLYLIQEARSKHKLDLELDQKTFKGATAKGIPLQYNGCDCGVYLLGYVERFMQNPQQFMDKLINRKMSIKEDWPEISPKQMRKRIRKKLCEVQEAQEIARQRRLTANQEDNKKRSMKTSKSDQEDSKYKIQVQNSDSPELISAMKGIRPDENDPKKYKVDKQEDSSMNKMILDKISKPLSTEPSNVCSPTASKALPKKQNTNIHQQDPFMSFCEGVKDAGAVSTEGHP